MQLNRLHPRLRDFVKNKGWKDLTDIQKVAFDPIFNGESCVIEAPTSGGKTEAVLFPLLTRMSGVKKNGFKVLYIAPLKALLNDLALRVLPYAEMCYLEAFKWHGDVSQSDKLQQMEFPSDILLTTPESIEAILLKKANWQQVFRSLETIVIDEAHYFALTERGIHLASLIERIQAVLPSTPQRIAVTATIGNPLDLLNWLVGRREGGQYLNVTSNKHKARDFKIHYFLNDGDELQSSLYKLLVQKKSIVFERSRSATEETATRINERNSNTRFPVKVKTHHSSISKQLREEAENSIKRASESSLNAIISTSTLELGIDIGELDQVIQIGGIASAGSFLQRVGRTGRRDGRPQFFRGLCSDAEELLLLMGCVSLGLKRKSEKILLPTKAFHIMAHQVICFVLQEKGATRDQVWAVLSNSFCFSGIIRTEFDELVEYMVASEYLRSEAGGFLLTGPQTENKFLKANWKRLFAIFDGGPMYSVVDGKKVIGTLDASFVMSQEMPFVFVLGGQEWNALKINHEAQQVSVQKNETGIPPKWRTLGDFDVPYELAVEIGNMLKSSEPVEFLDFNARQVLESQRAAYRGLSWRSDKWLVQPAEDGDIVYIWTFAGDKINRCIDRYLAAHIEADITYDYIKIVVKAKDETQLDTAAIIDVFRKMCTEPIHIANAILEPTIKVKWMSKFSECLPESLARKTIMEKGLDLRGTKRELDRVAIEFESWNLVLSGGLLLTVSENEGRM